MAIKITGDTLQADSTTVATLSTTSFSLAGTAALTASSGLCVTGSLRVLATGTDTGGSEEIELSGDTSISGSLNVTGNLALPNISEVGSDTDQFLCTDSGIIKYVDGSNLATYIGAVSTSANNTFTGNNTFSAKLSASNGISVTDGAMAVMTINDTDGFDLTATSATISSNTALTGTLNVTSTTELQGTLAVVGAASFDTHVTLASTGDCTARSFITYSDATLKTDVKPLNSALDKVMSMRGVSYEFKNQTNKDGATSREIGFLAQEMNKSVPEVVYGAGNGNLGIDYAKLTSVLVEAIKDQQSQIQILRDDLQTALSKK